MPDDVRIGIYATAAGILGVVTSFQAADGDWVTATLTAVTGATSLMSAIMTWRRRGWTPDDTE